MIGIVNYGSGNFYAIANIYKNLEIEHSIIHRPQDLALCEKLILPGVGSFDHNMNQLNNSGLRGELDSLVLNKKVPILGICLGMQIMLESSEEGTERGLGWVKGVVRKFDPSVLEVKPMIPHMGWNSISVRKSIGLFEGVNQELGYYFIHSYYVDTDREEDVMTTSHYGHDFVSSLNHENIFATQFHPEKSHSNGISLLKNFALL